MICRAKETEVLSPEVVTIIATMRSRDRTWPRSKTKPKPKPARTSIEKAESKDKKHWVDRPRKPGTVKPGKMLALIHSGYRCAYCGCNLLESPETLWAATVDHVQPRAAGGNNGPRNTVASCQLCNQAKGCRPAESVDQVRPAVLARREELLRNLVEQMHTQGVEFAEGDASTRQTRNRLEQAAVSLAQQADSLVDTMARLELLSEAELDRVSVEPVPA